MFNLHLPVSLERSDACHELPGVGGNGGGFDWSKNPYRQDIGAGLDHAGGHGKLARRSGLGIGLIARCEELVFVPNLILSNIFYNNLLYNP